MHQGPCICNFLYGQRQKPISPHKVLVSPSEVKGQEQIIFKIILKHKSGIALGECEVVLQCKL